MDIDTTRFPPGVTLSDLHWQRREKEYFLDVADDGYTIASANDKLSESDSAEIKKCCDTGEWYVCPATDCLGECVATGCSCSRSVNPTAREEFLRTTARRMVEASIGQSEVCYASLGSGLLRFDFSLLELLLAEGAPVTSVHLVDSMYDPTSKGYGRYSISLAQFASWFADRGVDVYVHASLEKFTFHSRRTEALPIAIVQVDCSELTWVFDSQVKPMLEEVLRYDGLFCALTSREGASGIGCEGSSDAWAEIWRLISSSGRMRLEEKIRFRPGQPCGQKLGADEPLPVAVSH